MENNKKNFDRNDPVAFKNAGGEVKTTKEDVSTPVISEGIVTNCLKLNLRAEPTADSKVLLELKALDKVTVNMDKSTDEFYNVRSSSGAKGYCMRQFITIKR